MNRKMECNETRRRLAEYREGWLSPEDAKEIGEHLQRCDACATEAAKDAKLIAALADLQPEPVVVPALSLPDRRRSALGWRPAVAAAAILAPLLLWAGLGRLGWSPVSPAPPVAPAEARAPEGAFDDAHFMLAASDLGSDPNRAIVLGGIGRSTKERNR